jgi:hypothetical protein
MIGFERLNKAWDALPKPYSRFFKIGPFTVQIDFHNPSLADKLTRAFNHLSTESSRSDLNIRLWNGSKLPPLDWNRIQTNGYRGYFEPPFYFHLFEIIGALSATDTKNNIAYYVIQDETALPWWVSGSPLQVILHVWFREKNMQLTHSACIAQGSTGILLAGKGGSGKSTTVLTCLQEGFSTLGEDYVLLSSNEAYSVYQTAKLQPHTRTLFPQYEPYVANPDTADKEKALVHYLDLFPEQLIPCCNLKAVVSLEVGSSTKLHVSDVKSSLQSLLLTTAMQLPHPDPRTAKLLQTRLQTLAHYRLVLGPDLKQNTYVLKGLLK